MWSLRPLPQYGGGNCVNSSNTLNIEDLQKGTFWNPPFNTDY